MESGRNLRSRKVPSPTKSPMKAAGTESTKKRDGKGGQKPKEKATAVPKAADVVSALHQAQEYISKSATNDASASRKAKRAREEDDDDDGQTTTEAAANELAREWMSSDEYALEIERRKENTIASLARYEPMTALAKTSLKGTALNSKLLEIKTKLSNLGEALVALSALNDKRYEEIYQDALVQLDKGKKSSKRRRLQSVPTESEDLDVSDGKSTLASISIAPAVFLLARYVINHT
jgi:hypothetical protein